MSVAALVLSSLIFVEAFFFLRVDRQVRAVFAIARDSMIVLADGSIGDDVKERCARRASRLILKLTVLVVVKLVAVAAAISAVFLGVAWAYPSSAASLLTALASPLVLVSVALVASGYAWVRNAILG